MTEVVQEAAAPSATDLEAQEPGEEIGGMSSPSWLSQAEAVVADGEKLSLVPAAPPSAAIGAAIDRKPTSGISLLSPNVGAAAALFCRAPMCCSSC
eukprot:COSAG02_NODE_5923_length_3939_cov_1.522135_2_plen_96_part_00